MKSRYGAVLVALVMVLGVACASKTAKTAAVPLSLDVITPSIGSIVKGNVVELNLEVKGISIVKADGDTSGKTGHFHVFVDRAPVAASAVIPKEAGIVHSTSNPVKLTGLSVGTHALTVVLGDGAHKRIGSTQAFTWVRVEGPTIQAKAATPKAGAPVTVEMTVTGATIAKADGTRNANVGHYHLFVDREPTAPGIAIPKEAGIIHTTESSITITGLTAGEHTIWVVLGDGAHMPFDPPVMDRVVVTVS